MAWIEGHVGLRFRRRLTVYTRENLRGHLLLLFALGLLLVLAAAGPGLPGEGEVVGEGGRVLLLLDASASMRAGDPQVTGLVAEPENRFALARGLARLLVEHLEGFHFGLVTFSGTASLQLPVTEDRELVTQALEVAEVHTFYRRTGSSFGQALDRALHFVDERHPDLQVVLLSDGEQPFPEAYDPPLAALAHAGVPVHTVAVGSTEGEGRLIYDFRDVVAGAEKPRVLREFVTRRVDEHLERISRETGGLFQVAAPDVLDRLERALRRHPGERGRVEDERARRDLAALPLGLFLALFLLELVIFDRRGEGVAPHFELERLGSPPRRTGTALSAVLLLAALAALGSALGCGDSPLERAHRENELGIAQDLAARHGQARAHYERSIAYQERPEIPTYNLARSVTEAGDFSEAHELYQQALELAPALLEAHYNDGVALYRWGAAERDPRGCQLERSLELWRAARRRFATVMEQTGVAPAGPQETGEEQVEVERSRPVPTGREVLLGSWAQANHQAVVESIDWAERLIANPPPECFQNQPQGGDEPQEGGGSAGQGGGTAQGEDPRSGGGGQGESEAGGQGEEEREGGGQAEEAEGAEAEEDGAGEGEPRQQAQEGEEPEGGGGTGAGSPQGSAGGGGGATSEPLTSQEREEVLQAYQRLAEQRSEEGKFFRRSLPEQFPKEVWENPEAEIWW